MSNLGTPGGFNAGGNNSKYRRPTTGEDTYHWFADGSRLPVKHSGARPLKQQELEDLTTNHDFHCKMFDCGNEADMAEFQEIMDRVYNGWYAITKRLDNWPSGKSHPIFWLEWVVRYRTVAQEYNR